MVANVFPAEVLRVRPHSKVWRPVAPKRSVIWLHCAMFVLVTSLCRAISSADIKFDFVLMSCAYTILEGQL